MKHLLIVIALMSGLLGTETNKTEEKSNFNVSGKVMAYYTNVNHDMTDETKTDSEIYYISTQLNIDYTYENFYFQATPYVYTYDTDSGEKIENLTNTSPYDKSAIFFRSLYMSYTFDAWTFGIGVLPFTNSMPMKFSDDSIQDGVGLNTLNDNAIMSVFGIYSTENSKTIFGAGTLDQKLIKTGNYISEDLREDTEIYFIINTYEHDKWIFTNELMYVDMKYDKMDLSEIYMYGIGVSWDDTEDSGLVVYNVAAASMYKNNSSNAKNEIYSNVFGSVAKGEYLESAFPDSFAMNTETYYGASNLLGIRYEMDFLPLETFINFEWFHTMGDWTSGNQGNIYNGKINQMFNIRDNAYYVNYGILTSKNSLLRFTYSCLEFDEFGKVGAPASTVPAENFLGGNKAVRTNIQAIHVIFTYKF